MNCEKKSIFWQLGTKIANFANIKGNNSVFTPMKKKIKLSVAKNDAFY